LEYLKFILYGLIQGLTEFIPVSSTAHLKIISLWFGIEDPGSSLSAIIQLGSVFAIFWYFRNDIFKFKISTSKNILDIFLFKKLSKSIIIGTIPIVLIGGFIKIFIPYVLDSNLRSNSSIAIISLVMAFFMFLADISRNKFINLRNHNYVDSLLIGLAQAFAIIPGVSRSGVTISLALLLGWERKDAAKFSFILGVPAILIAGIVQFIFSLNQLYNFSFLPLIICLTTTFFSSLFAIDFVIKYISSGGMKLFIYYRVIFGISILLNL